MLNGDYSNLYNYQATVDVKITRILKWNISLNVSMIGIYNGYALSYNFCSNHWLRFALERDTGSNLAYASYRKQVCSATFLSATTLGECRYSGLRLGPFLFFLHLKGEKGGLSIVQRIEKPVKIVLTREKHSLYPVQVFSHHNVSWMKKT